MKNKNQDKGPVDWGGVKVFLNKPIKYNSLGGVISFLVVLLVGLFFAQLILSDHLKVKGEELNRKGRNYNVGQSVEGLKKANNLNKKNTYNARPLTQDSEKVIYINSQNKYQRGGVIMQSTLDEPIIHISGKNINSKTKVEIFEADTKNIIDSLVYKKKEGDENQRVYQKETPEIDINDFSKISEFESVVPENRNIERQRVQLPINGEGNWLVRVSAEGVSSMTFIARYNFGVVVKEGKDKFVFWSQDLINKKSAENVEISGYNLSEAVKERFKDSTNESGVLELDRDKVDDSDILVAERNGSGVIVPFRMRYQHYHSGYDFDYSSRWHWGERDPEKKFFIFTDRPLYRPGDRVNFKAIIRGDDDAEFTPIRGDFIVRIVQGWGKNEKEAARKLISSGKNGTLFGDFEIAEDLKTGEYRLEIYDKYLEEERLEVIENRGYWRASSASFAIEHFRKPESTISVDTEKDKVVVGDKIRAYINGEYFSGESLVNAEVKYVVRASDTYSQRVYRPTDYNNHYGNRGTGEVQKGTVVLDEFGVGNIEIDTKQSNSFKNQIYSIEVSRTDEGGNQNLDIRNVLVVNSEFDIYQERWYSSGKVGEEAQLEFYALSHSEFEVGDVNVNAKIKFSWREKVEEPNEFRKYARYEKREEQLEDVSMLIKSGKSAVLRLLPQKVGRYEIELSTKDKRGNYIKKTFYFRSYEKHYHWRDVKGEENTLSLSLNSELYEPGDRFRVGISSEIKDLDALVTFERAKIRDYKVVKIRDFHADIERVIRDSDMPGFSVGISSFFDKKLFNDREDVEVLTEKMKTYITLETDKDKYRPGEEVELNVKAKNLKGEGVSSEVAVWTVDKSLFELMKDRTGDIHETFWYQRRSQVKTYHSLENISMDMAEKGGCFVAGTQILTKGGELRNIESLKDGEIILTKSSSKNDSLVEAKIYNVHSVFVDGYFRINDNLDVTGNHLIWVNDNWKRVDEIKIGDTLVDSNGSLIEVSSFEWRKEGVEVFNFEVEKEHSYLANGIWVHNGKGGGVRSVFKDVAYWNPVIRTNKNGYAKVSFKVPDNMTTWVIKGVAVNEDTMVGQNSGEFKVSKDVIIRPAIPNILRDSDNVSISAVVQNFTDKKREFKVGFSFDSGDVEEGERVVIIGSGAKKNLSWSIKDVKENDEGELKFWATDANNKDVSDILIKKIPIRDFGFWETDSMTSNDTHSYQLKLSEKVDLEKTNIELNIASTLLGTLPKAMDYLIKYPYGCVEQTTSRFVPIVIVRENPEIFKNILEKKDTEKMMKKGMDRLRELQNSNGSWGWWRGGDNNYFVSVYVFEYLLRAQEVGLDVDSEVLESAKNFFRKPTSYYGDMVLRSYALSLFEKKDVEKSLYYEEKFLEEDLLAFSILTNINNGFFEDAKKGAYKLIAKSQQSGNSVYWNGTKNTRFSSRGSVTALAFKALLRLDGFDDYYPKIIRSFELERKDSYWYNTFATAQISGALTTLYKKKDLGKADLEYKVFVNDKEFYKNKLSTQRQNDKIVLPVNLFESNSTQVRIEADKGSYFYSSLDKKEFIIDKEARSKSSGIAIERSYRNSKGSKYNLAVGDIVDVNLKVSDIDKNFNGYFAIEDQLPAGLVPVNQRFKNEGGQSHGYYWYGGHGIEITENGAIIPGYSDGSSKTYRYKARVVSAGNFMAPPATISMMYRPEVYARTEVQKVVTEAESKVVNTSVNDKGVNGGVSSGNSMQSNRGAYRQPVSRNKTQDVLANQDYKRHELEMRWERFKYLIGFDMIPGKLLLVLVLLLVVEALIVRGRVNLGDKIVFDKEKYSQRDEKVFFDKADEKIKNDKEGRND